MDQSPYAWLRQELRQHIDALLTVLDELVGRTAGLSPAVHTTLQGGVADLQTRLQAFEDLIESCLIGAGVGAEAQDALARLIEQVQARKQDVEDQTQRLRDAPTEDLESRLARLEAVWRQLDKTAQITIQELTPRPRPEEAQ